MLIRFLIKKAILIIVTKGIISFNIDGYFKKDKYKKFIKILSCYDIALDIYKRFINMIDREIIIKLINKYLLVRLNK